MNSNGLFYGMLPWNFLKQLILSQTLANSYPLDTALNSFVLSAPSIYPLKTLENLTVFWCFRGVEKGCIGKKYVKLNVHKTFRRRYLMYFQFASCVKRVWFRKLCTAAASSVLFLTTFKYMFDYIFNYLLNF